ncbi:MAG: hypothetical protein ACREMF_05875 [Gemmatimonadales bacterium]
MVKIVSLAGLATLLAAGTAPAQTSVQLSLGFGVPRPYVSGVIVVGRPHLRPVYRPCFYRPCLFHRHHGRPYYDRPARFGHRPLRRVIIVDRHHRFDRHRHHGFHRDRDDDRD